MITFFGAEPYEAMDVMESYGIPTRRGITVSTAGEAEEAAERIG